MTQNQAKAPEADKPIEEAPIVKHDLQALENVKVAGELDLLTAAKAFAASGMFPDVQKQSQAVVKIVAGYELGVKPFAAMRGIHFIKIGGTGVLELSANLRGALIKRSGQYDYRVRHLDDESCRIEFFERAPGMGPFESVGFSEYSVAKAKKAKLIRGEDSTWNKFPEDMVFAAALRKGAKRYCPDLFVGELAVDDAAAVGAVAERQLTGADPHVDIVDVDVVDAESDPEPERVTASGGGEQQDAEGTTGTSAPAADPSETLFGDGTPPVPTEPGEDVPDDEPVYVGLIPVHRAPELHEPADDTADRIGAKGATELRKLMPRIQLVPGALETVFKARYGFDVVDAKKATADDFTAWINAEQEKAKAGVAS